MEKRFLIALVLTALVVVATPLLFRGRFGVQRPAADTTKTAPATLRDTTKAAIAPPPVIVPAATPDSARASAMPAPGVKPETTTVGTPFSEYRFVNVGASPASVRSEEHTSELQSQSNLV